VNKKAKNTTEEIAQIAAKIYLLSKNSSGDLGLAIIEILNLLNGIPIAEVKKFYKRILNKEVTVAEVITATELSESQKIKFIDKINLLLKEEVTVCFTVDKSIIGGALIKVGDKVIDETITSALDKLISKKSQI